MSVRLALLLLLLFTATAAAARRLVGRVSAESPPTPVTPLPDDWVAYGTQAAGEFGYAVAAADVNGDGFSDILIGAPRHTVSIYREGAVFLHLGSAGGVNDTPAWTGAGGQSGARYGSAVAGAGDVNADGYADFIVGAYRFNGGQPEEGWVGVYLGGPDGPTEAVWTLESDVADAQLGYAVAGAGDVDGDGYDDVLAGARWYGAVAAAAGAAFLVRGGPGGPTGAPAWSAVAAQPGAAFGSAVAGVGDINRDGYADFAVGAPTYDGPAVDSGALFLYCGGPGGPAASADVAMSGSSAAAWLGAAVSGAGDHNGDGRADVLVGSPLFSDVGRDAGRATLFYGSTTVLIDELASSAAGTTPFAHFGAAVGSAGDVDGDGLSDVVVGAPLMTGDQPEEGFVMLFCGGRLGLSGSADFVLQGDKAEAGLGWAVGPAGDVNGDGFDDFIVGAPAYRHGDELVGRVAVIYGGARCVPEADVFVPLVSGAPPP